MSDPPHPPNSSPPSPLTLTLVAAALILSATGLPGCARRISVGLPPGLAEDEARRASAARRLALEAERADEPADAADTYRRAILQYREYPAAWNNLGVLMMNDERYLEAAEAFSTAADLSPSDPRPLYNLGLLWDRRGYLREARQFYERALDRDANFLPALRGAIRADSLLNEGTLQTLRWLEKALMLEQDAKWREWMRLQRARIESLPSVKVQQQF